MAFYSRRLILKNYVSILCILFQTGLYKMKSLSLVSMKIAKVFCTQFPLSFIACFESTSSAWSYWTYNSISVDVIRHKPLACGQRDDQKEIWNSHSISVFVPAINPSQWLVRYCCEEPLYTQRKRKALNEQISSEHRAKSCARDFMCLELVMDIHVIYCTYTHTVNRIYLLQRKFIACFRLGTNEDNIKDVVEGTLVQLHVKLLTYN